MAWVTVVAVLLGGGVTLGPRLPTLEDLLLVEWSATLARATLTPSLYALLVTLVAAPFSTYANWRYASLWCLHVHAGTWLALIMLALNELLEWFTPLPPGAATYIVLILIGSSVGAVCEAHIKRPGVSTQHAQTAKYLAWWSLFESGNLLLALIGILSAAYS